MTVQILYKNNDNSKNINEILDENCNFDIDLFSLDIDGIDCTNTHSNSEVMRGKFVIPNENTSGAGDNKIMKYHLKSNLR